VTKEKNGQIVNTWIVTQGSLEIRDGEIAEPDQDQPEEDVHGDLREEQDMPHPVEG